MNTTDNGSALSNLLKLGGVIAMEDFHPTGSTYFFGEGKDEDMLVLMKGNLSEAVTDLKRELQYTHDFTEAYPDACEEGWVSLRKGGFNLLLYNDKERYNKMLVGAKLCRFLANKGLLPKEDKQLRIAIHEITHSNRDPEDMK